MSKPHDRGSFPSNQPIDRSEHQLMDWERRLDGVRGALAAKGLTQHHAWRRVIEGLSLEQYESLSYHQRWVVAMETLLAEHGVLSSEEVDRKLAELEGRRS